MKIGAPSEAGVFIKLKRVQIRHKELQKLDSKRGLHACKVTKFTTPYLFSSDFSLI